MLEQTATLAPNHLNSAKPKIILAVCSSIACYKAVYLARLLSQKFTVIVLMSEGATKFIGPASFQAITHQPVYIDLWDNRPANHMAHIDVTRNAIAMVIAPCSANQIAQIAQGLSHDLISTTVLARPNNCPLIIAPAMNVEMWQKPSTMRNIAQLKQDGVHIIEPIEGLQACKEYGFGKMQEPETIVQAIDYYTHTKPLKGKHVCITAGATQEWLDDVRYLSNASSGLMGYELARQAAYLGAKVTLISGVTHLPVPFKVNGQKVVTAQQMFAATQACFHENTIDYFIAAAAVADWGLIKTNQDLHTSPKVAKANFLQHLQQAPWQLNPDILAYVGQLKKEKKLTTKVIGFAAQTLTDLTQASINDLLQYAQQKQMNKQADIIIANASHAINASHNQVWLIKQSNIIALENMPKTELAKQLWDLFLFK